MGCSGRLTDWFGEGLSLNAGSQIAELSSRTEVRDLLFKVQCNKTISPFSRNDREKDLRTNTAYDRILIATRDR
jgi:hypothetical protein